ncbi:tail protein X [Vibrio owensii]|jgi:phage tail protein X|uniref:tail protein X n=1 Tax=Vibrio owensii TaxID=696485 RepID=UPI002FE82953
MQYRTKAGDMLDAICYRYYKGRPQATEAVLEANPGLAQHGAVLPEGLLIELPDLEPVQQSRVSLWD